MSPKHTIPGDVRELAKRVATLPTCGKQALGEVLTALETGADPRPVLVRWVGEEVADMILAPVADDPPMSVGAYVMGLESFGFSFSIGEVSGRPHYFMADPNDPLPPSANAVVCELRAAFGTGRGAEVIAFLRERRSETGASA